MSKHKRSGVPFSAWISKNVHNTLKQQADTNNSTLTQEITTALQHYFDHVKLGFGITFMKKTSHYITEARKKTDITISADDMVWQCILEGVKRLESQSHEFTTITSPENRET